MSTNLQRTQIYLPLDLRKEIDKQRRLTGESLGEYMRLATQERLKREKRRKKDLAKLAKLVASLKPTQTKKEILEWEKEIRRDREESDKRMEERWNQVRKS